MSGRTIVVPLVAALLHACGPDAAREQAAPPDALQAVPAAAGEPVFVYEAPPDAQILFVGTNEAAFPENRPNAVFVPVATFAVERGGVPNVFPSADSMARMLRAAGVRGDRLVIVGEPLPAGRALAGLDYLGIGDQAVVLDGGPRVLSPAPQQTRVEARDVAPASLPISVREDVVVDANWVNARLDDERFVLIDARPPSQFSGETSGDGIERPGHIPGARNIFWQTLVRSADDTRLKDEAELRRIFEAAGVRPDRTVVAYCRTGMQAGFVYAVARELGYDVRLYDGSFIEWSRLGYAVERSIVRD